MTAIQAGVARHSGTSDVAGLMWASEADLRSQAGVQAFHRSLIPIFRTLIRLRKYAATFLREFTSKAPVRRAQLMPAGGREVRIRANSLFFSLIPGNLPGETGSQLTASSAKTSVRTILSRPPSRQTTPLVAG